MRRVDQPHIPKEQVEVAALDRLGAAVDARIYPGMGPTVNRDELEAARTMLDEAAAETAGW